MAAGGAATRTPDENVDVRIGRRVVVAGACAILLAAHILHSALPATSFSLPGPESRLVRGFIPQGWAFFTKSPRSVSVVVYEHQPSGTWRDITAGPLADPGEAFGLDRMSRSQGTELAMLADAIPKQAWLECEDEPTACLSRASAGPTLPNLSNHHSVCGDVGLVLQEVLPWAWRDTPTVMPSALVRMRVTC